MNLFKTLGEILKPAFGLSGPAPEFTEVNIHQAIYNELYSKVYEHIENRRSGFFTVRIPVLQAGEWFDIAVQVYVVYRFENFTYTVEVLQTNQMPAGCVVTDDAGDEVDNDFDVERFAKMFR